MNEVEVFYPTIYPNDVADVNIGPTISPAKRRRIDGPRTQTMFTSSRRQKRNVGKLEIVFNLPTDIFYEICSYLVPVDLLNMSRASKGLYQLLVQGDAARHWWRAAKSNLPGIPEPPPGFNEYQFANLLFGTDCSECTGRRAVKLETCLRVRLCNQCRPICLMKGEKLIRSLPDMTEELLECLPSLYGRANSFRTPSTEVFYIRSAEYIIRQFKTEVAVHLDEGSRENAKQTFIETHQAALAIRMYSRSLAKWLADRKEEKAAASQATCQARKQQIIDKLKEAGFCDDDFPRNHDPEWRRIVNQPRELTDRIWANIGPSLIDRVSQIRADRLERQFAARKAARRKEVEDFAKTLLLNRLARDASLKLCLVDVISLPVIGELESRDNYSRPITNEDLLAICPGIEQDLNLFTSNTVTQLIQSVQARRHGGSIPLWDTDQWTRWPVIDASFLGHPSTYFLCVLCGQRGLQAPKNLLCHRHHQPQCRQGSFTFDPIYTAVAEILLPSLGGKTIISPDSAPERPSWRCLLCSNSPMTWSQALAHFKPAGLDDQMYGNKYPPAVHVIPQYPAPHTAFLSSTIIEPTAFLGTTLDATGFFSGSLWP